MKRLLLAFLMMIVESDVYGEIGIISPNHLARLQIAICFEVQDWNSSRQSNLRRLEFESEGWSGCHRLWLVNGTTAIELEPTALR